MQYAKDIDFLDSLAKVMTNSLQQMLSVSEDDAARVCEAVTQAIQTRWGGMSVYIGKKDKRALALRDEQIVEEVQKHGVTLELCRRHRLSEQRIRQIVNAVKDKRKEIF